MNNLSELKSTLLDIHEKDKKQIINALIIAEIFAVLLLALVGYSLFSNSNGKPPVAILFMLALLPTGVLVAYLIMLAQAKKRPQKIEDFVKRLETGERINTLDTFTDYKLTLPLRIIRLRLFPMEYAHIRIGQNRTFFKLPLSEENVQPFKALVSQSQQTAPGNTIGGNAANWSSN
ncbi:hypothetical protein [Chitinophaga sp. 212800010-3]|uniref:hypothetical protein n=1 Tax=unclassified Chitinophaga TaxID=2619133 RepID=UPI002DEA126E|nr:PH domain-containing protein [Chitinophaga sp. 212800010-3]